MIILLTTGLAFFYFNAIIYTARILHLQLWFWLIIFFLKLKLFLIKSNLIIEFVLQKTRFLLFNFVFVAAFELQPDIFYFIEENFELKYPILLTLNFFLLETNLLLQFDLLLESLLQ